MTDLITLDNTITYEGSGASTLDGLIVETIKRIDVMPEHKQYMSYMDYTDTTLLNPSQEFAAQVAPKGLDDITETGIKKQVDFTFAPKKGVYQKEIGGKFTMSYLFSQWARNARAIAGSPDRIQAELVDVAEQTRHLVSGYDIRYAEEMLKLWTKGGSVTASNGPGSATPKGYPLFYATHPYGTGDISGTFSNIITATAYTNVTTGIAQLQAALDLLKQTKDDNGKFIKEATVYKLYCSRVRAVFWRQVLNEGSDGLINYSGQGTNANQANQFRFKGNIVEIVQLDLLGQAGYDGNLIGTSDMWFVTNPDYIKFAKAFRTYRLYQPRVRTWENNETDEYNTSIRAVVGVDHYSAELGIVGGNLS